MSNQKTQPLVSIVLPTWNRATFLKSAVHGVQQQTYKNFELLLVDDGSTDDTQSVIEHILAEEPDPRIRYIRLPQHIGGAQARNVALRQTRGEFIASQDDDDEWDTTFLEKQVACLSSLSPEYGMSYTSYWRVLSKGKKVLMPPPHAQPKEGYIYRGDMMKNNYHPYQAALIRKSVLDDVGLVNEKMDSLYDWEMWLRIAKKYKVAHVDEPLLTWNNTPGSNSNDLKKIWWRIDARKIILDEFGKDIKKFGYFPDHCSSLADLLMATGDVKQARSYLWQGIQHQPSALNLWLRLLITSLGKARYQKILRVRRETFLKKLKL